MDEKLLFESFINLLFSGRLPSFCPLKELIMLPHRSDKQSVTITKETNEQYRL